MAKAHWIHTAYDPADGEQLLQRHGCQRSECSEVATHGWQRTATEAEVSAEMSLQGPYGEVIRNPRGPHRTAVFACADHSLSSNSMTFTHNADCAAPDPGCVCRADN